MLNWIMLQTLFLSRNLAANRPGGVAANLNIEAREARRALRRIAL
jgi:hypothetical protein